MYQPTHGHFREDRLDVQHALIRAHPFGAMVTVGPEGLVANHFPFIVDADAVAARDAARRTWLARTGSGRSLDGTQEALVIFQGPHGYITPAWYPAKAETGKVVPTWNYALVHVYGRPRIVEDRGGCCGTSPSFRTSTRRVRPVPWSVSDAPEEFVGALLKAIVGVEIEITRIEGKWKTSQNQPEAAREGVVRGLTAQGDERSLAMAELVKATIGTGAR